MNGFFRNKVSLDLRLPRINSHRSIFVDILVYHSIHNLAQACAKTLANSCKKCVSLQY